MVSVLLDEEWRLDAKCFGSAVGKFFLEDHQPQELESVKALCISCPVCANCLDHSQSTKERYGVWGGETTSARQRKRTAVVATKTAFRDEISAAVIAVADRLSELTEPADIDEDDLEGYVMFLSPPLRALALA